MKEDIKVLVKTCSECEDYTEFYVKEELVKSGDYYHDKIDDYIEGFVSGLRYCGYDVIQVDEDFICEDCQSKIDYDSEEDSDNEDLDEDETLRD